MPQPPTLTVCVTAHQCADRLPLLLTEARAYADELLVAVDDASTDDTLGVARAYADRVLRFTSVGGRAGRARLAGADLAKCDWVLFLDDDEGMDSAFPALRDELLGAPVTHWYLPRRWLTQLDPPLHLTTGPWWPNWALRLARADSRLLVKPDPLHSSLLAVGPGGREPRTAILHYDRIVRTPAEIEDKVRRYQAMGQDSGGDAMYERDPGAPTAAVEPAPLLPVAAGEPRRDPAPLPAASVDLAQVDAGPSWAADITIDHPPAARAGDSVVARARVRNRSRIFWMAPTFAPWPIVGLSCRRRSGEELIEEALRERIATTVAPGESVDLLFSLPADGWDRGDHVLHWQMVSENEAWFDEQRSPPVVTRLRVG